METAEKLLGEWVAMVHNEDHRKLPSFLEKVTKFLEGTKTARGFSVLDEFTDSKGQTIRVQESSAAMEACCWIFSNDPKGEEGFLHEGKFHSYSPHLTKPQALRLVRALLKFVEEVE